jgi:hypothetical protein
MNFFRIIVELCGDIFCDKCEFEVLMSDSLSWNLVSIMMYVFMTHVMKN